MNQKTAKLIRKHCQKHDFDYRNAKRVWHVLTGDHKSRVRYEMEKFSGFKQ